MSNYIRMTIPAHQLRDYDRIYVDGAMLPIECVSETDWPDGGSSEEGVVPTPTVTAYVISDYVGKDYDPSVRWPREKMVSIERKVRG